jgi:hypothetical protein
VRATLEDELEDHQLVAGVEEHVGQRGGAGVAQPLLDCARLPRDHEALEVVTVDADAVAVSRRPTVLLPTPAGPLSTTTFLIAIAATIRRAPVGTATQSVEPLRRSRTRHPTSRLEELRVAREEDGLTRGGGGGGEAVGESDGDAAP